MWRPWISVKKHFFRINLLIKLSQVAIQKQTNKKLRIFWRKYPLREKSPQS